MTDPSSQPRRPERELPPATLYDPMDDPDTPFGVEPTETVVLLLVGEVDPRWAARTAVELCTTWARHGRRIVLADLFLENPVLHDYAGGENLEGVVDVFLYGASVPRSSRPVEDRGFFLIPAGTYTADVADLYRHPRWPKLVAGFRDADASLVLFAPAATADVEGIARWIGQVVLLGTPGDAAVLDAIGDTPVRGRIEPPSAHEPLAPRAQPDFPVVLPPPPARAVDPQPAAELDLPPPPVRPEPRSRRFVEKGIWGVFALVVLATAAYILAVLRPDLLPAGTRPEVARRDSAAAPGRRALARPVPAAVVEEARPVGAALPYSVEVANYRSFDAAASRLAQLAGRGDSALYFISPREVDRILYYQVLAGAYPDSATARATRDTLRSRGVIARSGRASPTPRTRPTPLAFQLGEYASAEAARAAADSLLARRIPVYPLSVPYSDATLRWRVYAGAYADSAGATAMRALLARAGLEAPLTERSGFAAPAPR